MRDGDEKGEGSAQVCCPPSGGRFAAGEDPAKREQIIDGASRVFATHGFDAASMNDVAREAGVSKGTIYVYFENKEQLFAALVARARDRFASDLRRNLALHDDLEEALEHYGRALATHISSDATISAMRNVIAVADRMPSLTRGFFRSAPATVLTVLKDAIEGAVASGDLVIEDTELAARQFIDMSTGTFLKYRLFGELPEPPPEDEINHCIREAVKTFMARYARKPG